MKVKELKKQLESFSDDTELIVAYWDRKFVSDLHDIKITPEVWEETVRKFEDGEFGWQGDADECIYELIEEA